MNFSEQVGITLLDKGLLAILIAGTSFAFNRLLEKHKSMQALSLEAFKLEQSRALEAFRTDLARRVELGRNTRTAIADLVKKLAAACHAMTWLTFDARHCPDAITAQRFESYDKEMHALLSDIMAARAILAALSPDAHRTLAPYATRIYELDGGIAKAKIELSQDKEAALQMLLTTYPFLAEFDRKLLAEIENRAEPTADRSAALLPSIE